MLSEEGYALATIGRTSRSSVQATFAELFVSIDLAFCRLNFSLAYRRLACSYTRLVLRPVLRVIIETRLRLAVLARSYSGANDLWKERTAAADGLD